MYVLLQQQKKKKKQKVSDWPGNLLFAVYTLYHWTKFTEFLVHNNKRQNQNYKDKNGITDKEKEKKKKMSQDLNSEADVPNLWLQILIFFFLLSYSVFFITGIHLPTPSKITIDFWLLYLSSVWLWLHPKHSWFQLHNCEQNNKIGHNTY